MASLRQLFPVAEQWAYLNHCAVSPLATPVVRAVQRFLDDQQRNGVVHEASWAAERERVRAKAAALVRATAKEVAFVRNTVEAISIVAEGLPWREGESVVTAQGEYPANVYPWLNLASRGVQTRIVADRAGRVIPEDVFAAVDDRTRLIALSFVEFTNGFRNDLPRIGEFCRSKGILFLVDAIQGLGTLPLDVEEARIDFLAAGAQKWLLGPVGIGLFYCRQALLDRLRLINVGPESMAPRRDYLPYEFKLRTDARRFEAGAQNFAGIYGLGAALDVLAQAGIAGIARHVLALLDYAVEGLRARGCEIVSSLAPAERSAILAFRHPRVAPRELVARLRAANVVVSARSAGTRVAPHVYNNRDDVDRLLAEVDKV